MLQNNSIHKPKVSVILTVYNREKLLNRCINSLLIQSYGDWELIAIDDGSYDRSYDVLLDYGKNYSNIHLIKQQNQKLPLSRNRGIKIAKGKYITFLDSDDEYEQEHLAKRVELMETHPEIDLIHGGFKILGDEYVRDKDNPTTFIHLSECSVGGTFFGKRSVFIKLGGFKNIEYSEDSDFLDRAKKQFRIEKVSFETYKYNRNLSDSLTKKYIP